MNKVVEEMVDSLFSTIPMNDELGALKEEISADSDERYDDLIASGVSEKDACNQLMTSLRGMERVIAETWENSEIDENDMKAALEEDDDNIKPRMGKSFSCENITSVDVKLLDWNLSMNNSFDDNIRISLPKEAEDCFSLGMKDDVFFITQLNDSSASHSNYTFGDLRKYLLTTFSYHMNKTITLNLPENMTLEKISVTSKSGDIDADCSAEYGSVTIQATSGDVNIRQLNGDHGEVHTTSGNVYSSVSMNKLFATSASGNISFKGNATTLGCKGSSGDITISGNCSSVTAVSSSVNVRSRSSFVNGAFISSSGNVEITMNDLRPKEIRAESSSGNVIVELPPDLRASISGSSTSGCRSILRESQSECDCIVSVSSRSGNATVK